MQIEIDNLEFVQGLQFEYIDSLRNSGVMYPLIFDNSCNKVWNSPAFVKITTAGRHHGLSTIYIRHNVLQRSKIGRVVEFQNTHIIDFESVHDLVQVNTLFAQIGLGSLVVD